MLVFVDEAGDTGLKLGHGSSPFFIITLVVFEHDDEAVACDQGISQLRRKLGLSSDFEFHFKETSRRLKKLFFEAVAPYRFFYVSFIIDKKKLFGETLEQNWEYRRIIGQREFSTIYWPEKLDLQKSGQGEEK